MIRQAALGAIVFAAVLILLFGLTTLTRPAASSGAGSVPAGAVATTSAAPSLPPGPSASAGPSPTGSPGGSPALGTAPPTTGDQVLVGAGDIADCDSSGDEATAALLDEIEGTVFTAGDNAYEDGSTSDFAECYAPSWGRHLDRTRPTPGNHDWHTKGAAGYLDYFGARAAPEGVTWYSYDLGTWHVVMLDSVCARVDGCGAESPQGRWLTADLAASSSTCTIAIFHHARFSSGDEHGNDRSVDPFWRALYAAGADVIVNGHDHDYERFAPQDPDGREDRTRGIRQFVVGTGGTPLEGFDDPVANSEIRASLTHGVLKLTLKAGSYDWEFVPTGTDFRDAGSATCH